MKIHDETCISCCKTMGEKECFDSIEEMMNYHKSQRSWIKSKWEDWIYYPCYQFFRWKIWENIRPGTFKHYYQRVKYGHSYQDEWGIDSWLIENLFPMIENLKKNHHGVPSTFFLKKDGEDESGNPTDEAIRLADQRFVNVLTEIIYGLKCAKKIQELDYNWKDNKEYKRLNKSVQRAFELIGRYLFTLWD